VVRVCPWQAEVGEGAESRSRRKITGGGVNCERVACRTISGAREPVVWNHIVRQQFAPPTQFRRNIILCYFAVYEQSCARV
jgi:hypothetical protein